MSRLSVLPKPSGHSCFDIHIPSLNLYLDARHPLPFSFVSHAHFDHWAKHESVICSEITAALIEARMKIKVEGTLLPFEQSHALNAETTATLYPAGHILGSSQILIQQEQEKLLYSGDFKLRTGLSAEKCATPSADILIMETTFGLPQYVFPPTEAVLEDIIHFCHETLDEGEVPVLLGYSLGKSQELLCGLAGAGLPLMLHPQTLLMTQIYASLGRSLPIYREFKIEEIQNHVVICPPQVRHSTWLRNIKKRKTAMITGWAMEPNAIYRYQCDAAFPLSDHADFPDLLKYVELVNPRRVYTVHGYAQAFAQTLRDKGIEAWALGQDNQVEMKLTTTSKRAPFSSDPPASPISTKPDTFYALAQVGEAIKKTSRKSLKVDLLASYFLTLAPEDVARASLFLSGKALNPHLRQVLNCGWAIMKEALLKARQATENDFRQLYQRFRDSSETAEALFAHQSHAPSRSLAEIEECFLTLAKFRGIQEKKDHLEKLFKQFTGLETKYCIKVLTGDLRIGLKEGLVEEAIAVTYGETANVIRDAHMLTGNIAMVVEAAHAHTLDQLSLIVFQPLQFMLASPEPTAEAIVTRMGKSLWVEDKYDGIRCQIHKKGQRVSLYSRELHEITHQFPEIVHAAAMLTDDFVADGELMAFENNRSLPFVELQKRLGRKGDDFFLGKEIPVILSLYDLLWKNGKSYLKTSLRERRQALETITISSLIRVVPQQWVEGTVALEAAFLRSRERGNEGLMIKDPLSFYTPGRRGWAWIKYKKAYATLDVVVVGVEYGHGKRREVLSDYTFAIRHEETDELLTIGKAYSGLTNIEITKLTDYFLQNILHNQGRVYWVKPEIVLEIAFDTIQPSTRHTSGYALRFPRIVRIRNDKTVKEIDTLAICRQLAQQEPCLRKKA